MEGATDTGEAKNNQREWLLGAVGLFVGCVGVFIQSWDLKGDLDHRYPFKIMNVPPPEYYVEISNTLSSIVPYACILVGLFLFIFLRRKKVIAGIVPIVLCPIGYVVGLWYIVSNGEYKDQLYEPINYDHRTADLCHQEFFSSAMGLLTFSVIVYLAFLTTIYFSKLLINSGRLK